MTTLATAPPKTVDVAAGAPTAPPRPPLRRDRSALHALLQAHLALDPEYGPGFATHLPMALHALQMLGASDERLAAFAASYRTQLSPLRASAITEVPADWRALRGSADAYEPLRAAFAAAIARKGADAVLRETVPALLDGLAGGAFHGLIRTGHAAEAGHDGELAAALAYWASRWLPLDPPPPVAEPKLALNAWVAALTEQSRDWRDAGASITQRMKAATAAAPYRSLAGRLAIDEALPAHLAMFAARRYAQTGDFTVLHVVTALRALRVLGPWIDDLGAFAPAIVHALTAALLASRTRAPWPAPATPDDALVDDRDWPALIAEAIASDDDHVAKLVHACVDHSRAFGDVGSEGPRLAAARRVLAGSRRAAPPAIASAARG